jgi:hypothetical protein
MDVFLHNPLLAQPVPDDDAREAWVRDNLERFGVKTAGVLSFLLQRLDTARQLNH